MIRINPIPVGYPAKQANGIAIRVMPFQTNAIDCSTYYKLVNITIDEEGKEIITDLADGNSPITEKQFTLWGEDNAYIEDIVLTNLSLERL
jgi:hypothetical protein